MCKKIAYGILFTGLISCTAFLMSTKVPASEAQATTKNLYPATAEVVELDRAADLVTVETASGIAYGFYGCEDYFPGDLVSMIMDDNGTPETILDDVIIDCRYSGYQAQ